MTAELATRPGLPGKLREDGYDLPPHLTFDRWLEIGVTLQQMQRSVNWWVGDWLRYGERQYGQDAYQAVQEITGHGDTAIRNAVWVAEAFPPATRVADLSWSHHRAVAELPADERFSLLEAASVQKMPVAELIGRVRERKRKLEDQAATPDEPPLVWIPQKSDLTDEARAELERRLAGIGRRHAIGYERAWLDALVWVEARDCFDAWRDE